MHVTAIYNFVGAPETYHCTFPAMIDDWREKWYASTMQQTDKLFGFGFVQVCAAIISFMDYCTSTGTCTPIVSGRWY
jgi:hypothetical protein